MNYFYPKYYVLNIKSFEGKPNLEARVMEIIKRCENGGATPKTSEEANQEIKGLSATERYELGKKTLQIEELKRSSVHFFNTPKGALESPQLIINHGMICPHSCQYCYWQKDLFRGSRITVYANSKERYEADLKIAMAIWRVFSAFLRFESCKNWVGDDLFVKFDKAMKRKAKDFNECELNILCSEFAEKVLHKWKTPKADRNAIKALLKDPDHNPKSIFNSGENNDSVALEHITDVQKDILIPTILSMDNAFIMLRTKSIHYDFLEQFKDHEKKQRIIISPSLIPQKFIEKYEPTNYYFEDRLKELGKLADWGFKIFPCFSPLIYENDTGGKTIDEFVQTFKKYLPPEKIQYYTLGSLRFSRMAIRNIRMAHPNTGLDSPYFVHPKHTTGDKYRYPKIIRARMYASFICEMNKNGYDEVPRFLQTETAEAWKALMTDKYKDLGLDLEEYQSGALDLKALTGSNGLPKGGFLVLDRGESVGPRPEETEKVANESKKRTPPFDPKRIFVQKRALQYPLYEELKASFPEATFEEFEGDHREIPGLMTEKPYRFLKRKTDTLILAAPGVPRCISKNNNQANSDFIFAGIGWGCLFGCVYCYTNLYKMMYHKVAPLTLYANVDEMLERLKSHQLKQRKKVLYDFSCTNDSIAEGNFFSSTKKLIETFATTKCARGICTTKATDIDYLLELNHNSRTTIKITINPPSQIKNYEYFTGSVDERISAINKLKKAGYGVGINFSPIILKDNWIEEYTELFQYIDKHLIDEAKDNLIGEAFFYTHRMILQKKLPMFKKHFDILYNPEKYPTRPKEQGRLCYRNLKEPIKLFKQRLKEYLPHFELRYIF